MKGHPGTLSCWAAAGPLAAATPTVCGVASTRPAPLAAPGREGRERLDGKDLSVVQSF